MSNKVFKNYQVNLGIPFQIRTPLNFNTINQANTVVHKEAPPLEIDEPVISEKESYEEIIQRAREEADTIIKEAHYEAMRLIENTEAETNEQKQKILEESWQNGYNQGISEAQSQYEALIQEAEFIREHARVEYSEVLEGIETDVVNTILDIAKKVIGIEISVNKEDILYLVKQAFEKCTNKERINLKVSPEDYDYLVDNKERLLSMADGVGELEIKKDASLKAGACIIETPFGSIDAGVQTKLEKIEAAFRQTIGK